MLQITLHMPQLQNLQKLDAPRQAWPQSTLGLLQIFRLRHLQHKMQYLCCPQQQLVKVSFMLGVSALGLNAAYSHMYKAVVPAASGTYKQAALWAHDGGRPGQHCWGGQLA